MFYKLHISIIRSLICCLDCIEVWSGEWLCKSDRSFQDSVCP